MVYKRDDDSDINGTSLKGIIFARYSELEKLFGEPLESDGYKISGEWVFSEEDSSSVFTVYDWKNTELYNSNLPSVRAFRQSSELIEFHIGGNTSCENFKNWIEYQLAKLRIGNE